MQDQNHELFEQLKSQLEGDLYTDHASRVTYATDASVYRQLPMAVIRPRNKSDIQKIIDFARNNRLPIIPRTAGTSLAGQVVGGGIVVDVSRYMTEILCFDKDNKRITVQPGVVRDELNQFLKPHGLFFSPETSTSNRCMIGGMVGNNACGAHSLVYGSTRDHVLEAECILSNGSYVIFKALHEDEFIGKTKLDNLEGRIYQHIYEMLRKEENQKQIRDGFPHPEIERRNTGYAIDKLLNTTIFSESKKLFNFCELLAGSEGTLAFMTEITLNLSELPPPVNALITIHMSELEHAFKANLIALKYQPVAIELMDDIILEQSQKNKSAFENAFFIQGLPKALLMVEFAEQSKDAVNEKVSSLQAEMEQAGYGYHFPVLFGSDIDKAWDLRKAGLGLLSNIPGDAKPVAVIEDTAVRPIDMPAYMNDFSKILKKHHLDCVYYAHIATGEIHLRPVINLKTADGTQLFREIATDTAHLVKKYRGSMSGEHGDGRLRGEFIPLIIGDKNFELVKSLKNVWDPNNLFNPGKITNTPLMNESLRYSPGQITKQINTIFDYSADQGYLRSAEKCNGTGDCRKSAAIGGTMCPSYQATRDEYNTTRARANILREYITQSNNNNVFDNEEIKKVLDLCLSCKACKSECPAGVDITKLKAEAMQQYYHAHGVPLRSRLIANIHKFNKLGMIFPSFTNFFFKNSFFSLVLKKSFGFAPERSIPLIHNFTFRAWAARNLPAILPDRPIGTVLIFNDEFTNFNDVEVGVSALKLLCRLGYKPILPKHGVSGRTYLSKGLLHKAKAIAGENIKQLSQLVSEESPLIGLEPSAILTFRDEYKDFFAPNSELGKKASEMARHCLTFEEFIAGEMDKNKISKDSFTQEKRTIKFHGHCYQKALSSSRFTKKVLQLPENYQVEEINSGCCGMAGAFGYEKEHYILSQQVGELKLFPAIRSAKEEVIIVAAGTSCRHQIKDGTNRISLHPAQLLYAALKE